LLDAVDYAHDQLGADKDEFVKELVDGAIGNNYPVPSRILKNSERVINAYLESALYRGEKLADQTELFPTEGGTAAIVYIFNSLKENKLIKKGDKIAINTPIFTPYLQIPELNDYDMVEVDLRSTEENNWEIQASEIDKLNDKDIKAFFIVNPSNPGAMAFDDAALAEIKKVVEARPDFIIITDDVYGTFVTDFKTVYSVVPHNTLLVYSYSKLFGATGWRLGVIAANKDNVFDRLIGKLDEKDKEELNTRYAINVIDPEKMSFIDRMVADSRSVGLYHTSGLSTPQQIMEVLFSLTHLLNREKDAYIDASKAIVDRRYDALYKGLKIEKNPSKENSKYL
jgi:aspartate 4-decarboxylase